MDSWKTYYSLIAKRTETKINDQKKDLTEWFRDYRKNNIQISDQTQKTTESLPDQQTTKPSRVYKFAIFGGLILGVVATIKVLKDY